MSAQDVWRRVHPATAHVRRGALHVWAKCLSTGIESTQVYLNDRTGQPKSAPKSSSCPDTNIASGPAKPSPAHAPRPVARCDASQSIQRLPWQSAQLQPASLIERLNNPSERPSFLPSSLPSSMCFETRPLFFKQIVTILSRSPHTLSFRTRQRGESHLDNGKTKISLRLSLSSHR